MSVPVAYLSVILLWATTPLAIKWSGEGPGYLFGVTGRMAIGTLCVLLLMLVLRRRIPWHRKAVRTYLLASIQVYGAMLAVYWASQFIPSGWISVVFGLSPLLTALMAAALLGERSLTWAKLSGYLLGLAGLAALFGSALELGPHGVYGIIGVLLSAFLQCLSAVGIKRMDAKLPALTTVAGGLMIALPAYLLTWALVDGQWPELLPTTSIAAIAYLGAVATTVGFALYYYVLSHLSATRVAMISLISPVLALYLGHVLNDEPLSLRIVGGTALILAALLLHQWAERRVAQEA
ncbi:DMT family transporter [Methylococcus geothermalis]|uniref:EamA family transporter n=1 Tax=Methylococcus geothermalis TaxID=2681310 RepID=A0A858Q5L5_9GAMM|nr:DMT family transporter [Methylococcus geothermalis]QJD29094.1 EamA family transporter [Methylococcus geothermalis]